MDTHDTHAQIGDPGASALMRRERPKRRGLAGLHKLVQRTYLHPMLCLFAALRHRDAARVLFALAELRDWIELSGRGRPGCAA